MYRCEKSSCKKYFYKYTDLAKILHTIFEKVNEGQPSCLPSLLIFSEKW